MKPLHWFAGGLGAILGIGHIGMIGMIANRNTFPTINPPVGEYSSYTAKVGRNGYEIDYKGNDPKTMEVEKFVDKKNGFFGIGGKSVVTFKEEYTMDGQRHLGGSSEGKLTAANVACIKAVGGGEQTGRVVGASMGAAAAGYVTGIPFVGPVLGGLVAIFGGDKGAEVGGEIASDLSEDCEDGDTKNNDPHREIGVQQIPRVYTPEWLKEAPTVIPPSPPVTQGIGVPIINMPGCVEAHESNKESLKIDDPKGVKVYCDSGVPSFKPIDYDKNKIKWKQEKVEPPKVAPPDAPETKTPPVPKNTIPEIKCPTEVQKLEAPVGTLTDAGKKKIVEYRIVEKQCVAIKEDLKLTDQIIKAVPSTGQVTTTVSITIVATAAATATPFLLKIVKPIVKQIIKKIKKALGKEPPKLSANEIRANKYREKKGLPELKQPKKKK